MMEPADIRVLEEMRRLIAAFQDGDLAIGRLADHLTALRDALAFNDREWSHALTQHIVTLDSASTFVPANDEQARQLCEAIATATNGLIRLIDVKIGS